MEDFELVRVCEVRPTKAGAYAEVHIRDRNSRKEYSGNLRPTPKYVPPDPGSRPVQEDGGPSDT